MWTAQPLARRAWTLRLLVAVALAAVVALALSLRMPELARPGTNYDEGVYLESLLLMRHGYRPFVDIVATQGPLHLHLAYVSYALGGYTLGAARVGSVLASVVALVGVGWAASLLGGRVAAIGAAFALALSPTYLAVSRQALPEAPAVALAALAVGAAAAAHRTDRDRWRLTAAALLGAACLVKPIVAPAAVPVLLLASTRRSLRSTLLVPVVTLAVGAVGLAAAGSLLALDQVVGWRVGGDQLDLRPAGIGHNVELLIDKMFRQEQPAFYALAAAGGLALVRRSPRAGLAVVGWLASQLALLLAYANLHSYLGSALVAPLAVLAGAGAAAGWSAVSRLRWRDAGAVAALMTVWYAASVPALLDRDRRLIEGELSTDRGLSRTERDVVQTITRMTDPDDWVITDAPYLAFLADRKVPPALVDPSEARIASGALTAEQAITILRGYDPALVVLWTGKLARLQPFGAVLTNDLILLEEHGTVDDGLPRAIYRDPDDAD
jgi:hypothetical protein